MVKSINVQQPVLEAAHAIADAQDSVLLWEQWIALLLSELEVRAEEYDFYHPTAYEKLLQELREHIELRLRLGSW